MSDNDTQQPTEPSASKTDDGGLIVKLGDNVDLTKLDPTMKEMVAGLGWQLKGYEGEPLDLDVSVFLLDKNDQTREDDDFIFFNNLVGCDGAVEHAGDNRIGAGEGDDETIRFKLANIPFDVVRILFVITIYQGDEKGQDFSGVNSAYLRLFNEQTSREILRINIDEAELTGGTALQIAALERMGPKWEFHAKGDLIDGGLKELAEKHGIVVGEY